MTTREQFLLYCKPIGRSMAGGFFIVGHMSKKSAFDVSGESIIAKEPRMRASVTTTRSRGGDSTIRGMKTKPGTGNRDKYNPALKAERDRMYASRLAAVQQVPTRLTNASTKGTYQPPAWPSYRKSAADDVASRGVAC